MRIEKIELKTTTLEIEKDSIYKSVDFLFESGAVRLYCINWSKEIRESKGGFYDDSLTVIIYDSEFLSFLKTNAF